MGCVIYFVLSHGKHPFDCGKHPFDPLSCQVEIKKKKDENLTLSDLEGEDKFTAENLVRAMIKSNHESRYDFTNRNRVCGVKTKGKLQISLIFLNNMIHQNVCYLMMFIYTLMTIYLLFYRPSSGEVLAHCLFWSKDKRLKFFQEVSDRIQWAFKNKPPGSIVVDDLETGARNVFVNDWKDSIDEELKQGMIMLITHSTIYLTC